MTCHAWPTNETILNSHPNTNIFPSYQLIKFEWFIIHLTFTTKRQSKQIKREKKPTFIFEKLRKMELNLSAAIKVDCLLLFFVLFSSYSSTSTPHRAIKFRARCHQFNRQKWVLLIGGFGRGALQFWEMNLLLALMALMIIHKICCKNNFGSPLSSNDKKKKQTIILILIVVITIMAIASPVINSRTRSLRQNASTSYGIIKPSFINKTDHHCGWWKMWRERRKRPTNL